MTVCPRPEDGLRYRQGVKPLCDADFQWESSSGKQEVDSPWRQMLTLLWSASVVERISFSQLPASLSILTLTWPPSPGN